VRLLLVLVLLVQTLLVLLLLVAWMLVLLARSHLASHLQKHADH
jgi:hypothetical protein